MNTVSPTGTVHAIESNDDNGIITVCHHNSGPWIYSNLEQDWDETEDPVTCKRCLLNMGKIKAPHELLVEYKAALEFYADSRNYHRKHMIGFEANSEVEDDRGGLARKVLENT